MKNECTKGRKMEKKSVSCIGCMGSQLLEAQPLCSLPCDPRLIFGADKAYALLYRAHTSQLTQVHVVGPAVALLVAFTAP